MVPVRQLAPCKLSPPLFSVSACLSFSLSLCLCEHHPYELRQARAPYVPGHRVECPAGPSDISAREKKGSQEMRTCGIICYVRSRVLESTTVYLCPSKSAYVSGKPKAWRSRRSLEHVNVVSSISCLYKRTDLLQREQITDTFLIALREVRFYARLQLYPINC